MEAIIGTVVGQLSGNSGYDGEYEGEEGWLEAFGEMKPRAKTVRTILGLTQLQMAMKFKTSLKTIKRLEKGSKQLPEAMVSNAKFDPSQHA